MYSHSFIVSHIKSIRSWLAPEDRVLSHLAENSSHLAHDREEMTCQWVDQYLSRFLKSPQPIMSFYGKPGSGKTVLASVIVDILQKVIGGVSYQTLFVPISQFFNPVDRRIIRCANRSRCSHSC